MDPEQNSELVEDEHQSLGEISNPPLYDFSRPESENVFSLPINPDTGKGDGFLQEQEILEACRNINNSAVTSPRKRKIDKDGFVTPATPDIPKASCHFGQAKVLKEDGHATQDGEDYNLSSDQTCSSTEEEEEEESCYVVVPTSSEKDRSLMAVDEVIKDMSDEAKHIYQQFSRIFRESTDYEEGSSKKLDKMIADAIALEENLNQQKQLLCSRLKGLSRTLQLL